MKKIYTAMLFLCIGASLTALAQEDKKDSKKISEYDEIIIKQKAPGKNSKVTVEVKDGNVTVNGKPIDQFEDQAVIVQKRRPRVITLNEARSPFRTPIPGFDMQSDSNMDLADENRPFLGVSTSSTDGGVRVQAVTPKSGAEKAGIKQGDLLLKINEKTIESPAQLSELVSTYKPEDKVTVTVKRDGKELKLNAVIGKHEGPMAMTFRNGMPFEEIQDFRFEMPDGGPDNLFITSSRGPRLGLRAQDTEDEKGVKVLDVDDDSPADKAGIKEDDIITAVEGKAVNSADELAAAYKENKEKNPVKFTIMREGKTSVVEVKIPKRLKTANL